jgi:hypothetical protein
MRLLTLAAGIAALLSPHPAAQQHWGPVLSSRATYYSTPPCDDQGTVTASGQNVHFGVIASDWLPLYTRIRLTRPLFGRRDFQILDTGAHLDVWLPCGPETQDWTNPTLYFQVLSG